MQTVNFFLILIALVFSLEHLTVNSMKTTFDSFRVFSDQDTLHLQADELELVEVNNEVYGEVHRAGYNGIAALYVKGKDQNFFRPDVSALNFEFILNGDSSTFDFDLFEPRKAPILEQPRTENWPIKKQLQTILDNLRLPGLT